MTNEPLNDICDSLLIVHASTAWLNNNLRPSESNILKNRIRKRIFEYLKIWKKIYYTPYVFSDNNIPDYFPESKLITWVYPESQVILPTNMLIKAQIILLRHKMILGSIKRIEIWWVMHTACVKSTHKNLNAIKEKDIEEFRNLINEDIELKLESLNTRIKSSINYDITDKIFARPNLFLR